MFKRPELPEGFQGKVYKDKVREGICRVCDQLIEILLVGWQWGNWESAPSNFWLQPVWGLQACGQRKVNFFQLVGVLVYANSSKDMAQDIIHSPWGGTKRSLTLFHSYTVIILSCMTALLSFCILSLLWLNLLFEVQGRPQRLVFSTDRVRWRTQEGYVLGKAL